LAGEKRRKEGEAQFLPLSSSFHRVSLTSSPSLEKLADRMEGETMMSFFEHLSTRDVAATLTVFARETRTADEAPRANLSAAIAALWFVL
jgi:hypothetical protein